MGRKSKERRSCRARAQEYAKEQDIDMFAYLAIPDGVKPFEIKKDKHDLDFIPYEITKPRGHKSAGRKLEKGDIDFKRDILLHKNVGAGPDGKGGRSFICLKTFGKECPACEKQLDMANDPEYSDEEVKSLKAKKRQLFRVIDRKGDGEIQYWDISYHLFGKLMKARLDQAEEDEEWDRFCELEEGMFLRVYFEEKKFRGVTFHETTSIDFKNRPDDYDDELIDEAPNLDEILIELSADEIKKILRGIDEIHNDEEEDEEEEDNKPDEEVKPKRGRKGRKKEEEDEEEEEEEEEKPKRGRKGRKKEEEEEEDEEEEEEEKPKRGRRSRKGRKKEDEEEEETEDEEKADEEEEEEEEEEKPKRGRRSRKGRKKEDEEEEEEEKPKRGRKGRKKDEEEDEEEEEKPKRGRKSRKESKTSDCPSGHELGKDCDETDDCDECAMYKKCFKVAEEKGYM